MDITLYEEINDTRMEEVIACSNIPFDECDDEQWKEKFKKQLKIYRKKKRTSRGYEIRYIQPNKYGRFCTKIGLQIFQKDVRKYISGEFVRDYDFVNCHPVLLEQLLKTNRIYCGDFLENYNKNREKTIITNNLKDKLTLIRIINNENEPSQNNLKELHSVIYKELLPKLLSENDNKTLMTRITRERKKNKKDYNHKGAFISMYLQNVENTLLMAFYKYLKERNVRVHTLCFDGLTIDSDDSFDIEAASDYIKNETGYTIDIVEKSTKTNWVPNIKQLVKLTDESSLNEGEIYCPAKNLELFLNCVYEDESENKKYDEYALNELVHYINKFVCKVNYPHAYGWRNDTKDIFELRSADKVKDRIRFGFDCPNIMLNWKNRNDALLYTKFEFNPSKEGDNVINNNYNLYIRPPMKKCPENFENEHVFFSFLKSVICNDDEALYRYILNYISKMVRIGKTGQALVLLGGKGTGKSTFCEILKLIIGEQYHQIVNDIERLTTNFNSLYEKCILTQVEEVVGNGADYHKVQNKLKTLITENDIIIERKGIDSYMSKSFNNFILLTNYYNPVNITEDNRRFCVTRISNKQQNNYDYFKKLRTEVKEHVEELRHFFYTFEYVDDLNSIRPKTEEEKDLVDLNKSAEQKFIETRLVLDGDATHFCRELTYIYSEYKKFCGEIQKKYLTSNYFAKMLKVSGYETERIQVNGKKERYVQGETERKFETIYDSDE